ncbi:hypothetical protein KQI84_02370 [bacterium]|nr:hypothetical protein [bacterium]
MFERSKRELGVIAGLILGALFIGSLTVLVAQRHQRNTAFEKLNADFRLIDEAIFSRFVDWSCGPPPDSYSSDPKLTARGFVTFGGQPDVPRRNGSAPPSITTPIVYLKEIPSDPFYLVRPYSYIHPPTGEHPSFGLVISAGPDGDFDLDQISTRKQLGKILKGYWYFVDPELRGQVHTLLAPESYDPTNGATSSGDILRFYAASEPVYGYGIQYSEIGRPTDGFTTQGTTKKPGRLDWITDSLPGR